MTSVFVGLFRFAFFVAAASLGFGAVFALFGFVSPLLDALNHLQPLWFFGTLLCLLLTGAAFRNQRSRALMLALSATGFLSSGIIVMPEVMSGFLDRPDAPPDAPAYRLVSFNLFGLNEDMHGVAEMIRAENADIVALNEYFPEQRGTLHPLLIETHPHFAICAGGKRANLAVYARMPFESLGGEPCSWDADRRTGFLVARFGADTGQSFTIVATQLDWPVQISPLLDGAPGGFLERLDGMTARQRGEFAHLAAGLQTLSGPLLLAGDLNATPWSYALRRLARDSRMVRETRNLPTFPLLWHFDTWRAVPAILPLDHVMSRDGAIVTDVRTGPASGSDHLPVIVDFAVSAEAVPASGA
ncbi:MAG: endonuclease/exonuclease/phosphatase family protein [Alphaproteobacteria bacterium]|nr:endonuclease/exonuclease/phosphatase family protein [Alphaproteobacteria bacterium]